MQACDNRRYQFAAWCASTSETGLLPATWGLSHTHFDRGGAAQPKAQMWPWHQRRMALARNDFFQFGRPDSLALGGAPQYALYLDGDLQFGSSGCSDTFGSPCLASDGEFEIGRVELWGLV